VILKVYKEIEIIVPHNVNRLGTGGGGREDKGFAWKYIGQTPDCPDFVYRECFILLTF
jgi:hypothetical protein